MTRGFVPHNTALQILFDKYKATPEEFAVWVFMAELTTFDRHGKPAGKHKFLPEAFFRLSDIEAFDPNTENMTGRWLTFPQLMTRWLGGTHKFTPAQLRGIIQSRVDEAKREGNGLASPDKQTGILTPCCPVKGIAEKIEDAIFQLRQIERIEADHPEFVPIS
ncbi:hypothetical protein [Methylomagnum sp.]